MASIHKQITIDAAPEAAWDALRDFGALHERLAAGFATGTQLDGRDRIVTFFNGTVLRERLVDRDDDARRLAWSIVDGPYTHHNGVAQVSAAADGGTLFTWTADLLPDEAAPRTAEMMDFGLEAIKRTLEAAT
jgi:Polyketide cyclase / dehydrase and lipid transport